MITTPTKKTRAEKLAARRDYWRKTRDAKSEQRKAYRRAWYHRTKADRQDKLKLEHQTQYHRHKLKLLAKNKRWCAAHPEQVKLYNTRKKLNGYGLSISGYEQILELQNRVCAICFCESTGGRKLAVDHCHATNKIRGLLCSRCNQGLGMFNDSIQLLTNAISYLAKQNTLTREIMP